MGFINTIKTAFRTYKLQVTVVYIEIQIITTIPQLDEGKELDASVRRSFALVNIAENYPPETLTRVYTDGSETKAITDGGAGIIIQYPSGATQTASSATGKHCTNYRAETEALKKAAILVKDSLEPWSPTVFLADALSVLEAIQINKSPLLALRLYHSMSGIIYTTLSQIELFLCSFGTDVSQSFLFT